MIEILFLALTLAQTENSISIKNDKAPEEMGSLNCTISVSGPGYENGVSLKSEKEFGLEIVRNKNEFEHISGAVDGNDFDTDIHIPGQMEYDIYFDGDKGNPTGFNLPGSELAFLRLKYTDSDGQSWDSTAVGSLYFLSALGLDIKSESIDLAILSCTPRKTVQPN